MEQKHFVNSKKKVKLYEQITISRTKPGQERNKEGKHMKERTIEAKEDKDEKRHRKTSMRLCFNCGDKGHLSNECPDKAKGPKCFVCSGYGHVSTKCPEKNNRSESSNMTLVEVVPRNSVKLDIDDIQMIALLDTGSDITAIRQDVYGAYFKDIDLNGESVTLRGIGVAPMGFFERNVFINKEELVLKIHVIPCETSNFKAIVGNDILAQVDVVFRDGEIVVFKKERHNFLWTITLDEEANKETEIVIHIKNEENRKEVKKLIEEYHPEEIMDADVAKDYGLDIKKKKCQLLKTKIEFLGFIIDDGIVQPSNDKTLAIKNYPQPTTLQRIQSFLGLTGYFRKFISSYSVIAKPLSDLLRKEQRFVFGYEQKEAFEKLKKFRSCKPVLHIHKQGGETELHTDASKYGYGACLLQKSNEDAFQKTMAKKDLTTRVAGWALLLEEYSYEIEHRKENNKMSHVDALSRHPNVMTMTLTKEDGVVERLRRAQELDEHILAIKKILSTEDYEDFFVKSDILYKFVNGRELIVVPKMIQTDIIKKAHEIGHFALPKTEKVLNREFFIPKLKEKIQKCLGNCIHCILDNRKEGKKEGMLHPIPKQEGPLHTYHVDHLGPMPSTNKNYHYI
ncbi:hypothetical protein JTB14_002005 [Gonioctena quinquepunctata]|nr:hypothetical protein JTB14_002005 [Gonioctena quinquepunctata]